MERKWSIKDAGDVDKISGSYIKREDFIEKLLNSTQKEKELEEYFKNVTFIKAEVIMEDKV